MKKEFLKAKYPFNNGNTVFTDLLIYCQNMAGYNHYKF